MTISNLPRDLVEDILTRVPLKSMRAVRLTCKKWNTLSKTRSFTKMHLDKEATTTKEDESQMMIVIMNDNLHLMSIVVNENPSIEAKGKLTFLNDLEQIKISEVFHCEGLLLCILKDKLSKIVVWNPYLGQTRWIKNRDCDRSMFMYMYTIGYEENKKNKSFRNHKILRFIHVCNPYGQDHFLRYEIYDFDSDQWKNLDVTLHWRISIEHPGVSLKGNTYWYARERNSCPFNNHIICFDFTRERFGPLLSLPFYAYDHDLVTLSCVREEKLATLHEDKYWIEIWITTKIETEKVSWSKIFTVDTRPLAGFEIIDRSFFIDEEKKVAMVFDKHIKKRLDTVKLIGENGYFRELGLGEHSKTKSWPLACSYVPSLVQIKKHEGGKRKTQSNLERRCFEVINKKRQQKGDNDRFV